MEIRDRTVTANCETSGRKIHVNIRFVDIMDIMNINIGVHVQFSWIFIENALMYECPWIHDVYTDIRV